MLNELLEAIKTFYMTLYHIVLNVPTQATIGTLVIICTFLFIIYRHRNNLLIILLFILVPLGAAYIRSSFATQPFYEMYQRFIDYGVHFHGKIPREIEFLFIMNMDDWLNAAYWFGAGLSISMGYISFFFIQYSIRKLVSLDPKIGVGLLFISVKTIFGNNILSNVNRIIRDFIKDKK